MTWQTDDSIQSWRRRKKPRLHFCSLFTPDACARVCMCVCLLLSFRLKLIRGKKRAAFDLKPLHAWQFIEKQYLCLLVGMNRLCFSYSMEREGKDKISRHLCWTRPARWTINVRPSASAAIGFESLSSSSIRLEFHRCMRLSDGWRAFTLICH